MAPQKQPTSASKPASKTGTNKTAQLAHFAFDPRTATVAQVTPHMKVFKCKIFGDPKPQQRSFASTKQTAKVHLWNPSKNFCDSFSAAVTQALQAANKSLFDTESVNPVKVTVRFFFPRPKTHFKWDHVHKCMRLRADAPTFAAKKPDLDNCIKLLLDALQGVCFKNDFLVCHMDSAKLWDHTHTVWTHGENRKGCTLISVSEIDESVQEEACTCLSCSAKKNK